MNDQINAIEKLANVQTVKVIAKVIDVNDVVQVIHLTHEAINAHEEMVNMNQLQYNHHMYPVYEVHIMLIKNHMIHVLDNH
jgi:hypothetical protein